MDVFSTELGIQLSFVKNSELQGVGLNPLPRYAIAQVGSVCVYGGYITDKLETFQL
jgi:hypothetical protein